MRVHLLTIGSAIADDLDVAAMLREDGHVLVSDEEAVEAVVMWNPKCKPLYVVSGEGGPSPAVCYSLHGLRVLLKDRERGAGAC